MCEALLMTHWREWKHTMPETPSGTEQISRATQPDVKASEGDKSVIYCATSEPAAGCSGLISGVVFELAGQVRLRSMQVTYLCQQELPCFALFSIFSITPALLPSCFLYSQFLEKFWQLAAHLSLLWRCFWKDSWTVWMPREAVYCARRRLRVWWYRGLSFL